VSDRVYSEDGCQRLVDVVDSEALQLLGLLGAFLFQTGDVGGRDTQQRGFCKRAKKGEKQRCENIDQEEKNIAADRSASCQGADGFGYCTWYIHKNREQPGHSSRY